MLTENSKQFLNILHNMKTFVHKTKCSESIPHSEFMMMMVIMKVQTEGSDLRDGVTASEISKKLKITKSAVSKLLNTMEEKGYVEKIPDKEDRRVVYLKATDTGRKIVEDAHDHMDEMTNQIMNKMGEEDAATLIRLLSKLYQIMEEL